MKRRTPLAILLTILVPLFPGARGQEPTPEAKQDKWDVTAHLGPVSKLSFETSEGTWMNLDVSPDGRTIVFHHLGDK